jgi:ubiquinone/menaquinone biosynthesis C-methylase UbiE
MSIEAEQKEYWDQYEWPILEWSYARKLKRHADPLLKAIQTENLKLLDVGCGDGRFGAYLQSQTQCHVTGVEFSENRIQQAKACLNDVVMGTATSLNFEDEAFDVVMEVDVLHHLDPDKIEDALTEMLRVLKPGGGMYLIEPNRWHPMQIAYALYYPHERMTLKLSTTKLERFLKRHFTEVKRVPINYYCGAHFSLYPQFTAPLMGYMESALSLPGVCILYGLIAQNKR